MVSGPNLALLEGGTICHVKWLHHLSNICHVACLLVGPWIHVKQSFTIHFDLRVEMDSRGPHMDHAQSSTQGGPIVGSPDPLCGTSQDKFCVICNKELKSTSGTSY